MNKITLVIIGLLLVLIALASYNCNVNSKLQEEVYYIHRFVNHLQDSVSVIREVVDKMLSVNKLKSHKEKYVRYSLKPNEKVSTEIYLLAMQDLATIYKEEGIGNVIKYSVFDLNLATNKLIGWAYISMRSGYFGTANVLIEDAFRNLNTTNNWKEEHMDYFVKELDNNMQKLRLLYQDLLMSEYPNASRNDIEISASIWSDSLHAIILNKK